jgi:hypothetical protein
MLRESKIIEQMELLGIQDVTTNRQRKNGTVVWRLPIKINYPGNNERLIEVASFKSGYVRNQNCGYSNYQLNKRCEGEPEYFELPNGDYRKFSTRSCVLIPKEIDRLEYLIKYCVKNYYIKHANQVSDGKFVPEWEYDNACKNGHRMLEEQKQYENQRVQSEVNKMNAKQEQLINKIERIKTFLKHELF